MSNQMDLILNIAQCMLGGLREFFIFKILGTHIPFPNVYVLLTSPLSQSFRKRRSRSSRKF